MVPSMSGAEPPPSIAPVDLDDAAGRAHVQALLERASAAADHPGLSESALLSWRSGQSSGLLYRDGGTPAGYAQLDWRGPAATIELVVDAGQPGATSVRRRLLEVATATAARRGAEVIRYWVTQHEPTDGDEARALGFSVERDLLQVRVPLPLAVDRPPLGPGFTLRAFRPGSDETAWLEVNNRAFAAHPEQGDWDLEALVAREGADWFDAAGFILCETEGRLAGSCWTKVHRDRRPVLGEIYVISVDPDFQGLGLGRALVVAGLDWLAHHADVGMLYVDQSNVGALELYGKLGFTLDHVDRCYVLRPGVGSGSHH
jgi:mycothiol synthase